MKIKWLGHACFLLTSEAGVRLLTDPYDDTVGYKPLNEKADIVTTSHGHYDHSHIEGAGGSARHLSKPGSYMENGIKITGIATFHDKNHGAKRGPNVIFKFEMDGVSVCHCGDLGHMPAGDQLEEIGSIDVLLVPVGGTYTLDFNEAVELIKLLKPKITIPMHYKTVVLSFPLDGVEKFLAAAGKGEKTGVQEIQITREKLEELPDILVLNYE